MTEIKTAGLKGLYNRINLFASIQREDVFDVVTFIDQSLSGSVLASNRVMLVSRTISLVYTGKDLSKLEFLSSLYYNYGMLSSKEELKSRKNQFQREFNTASDNIGEGYRETANKVMLIARAEHHINTLSDLMPYEYIQMLLVNSAVKGYK